MPSDRYSALKLDVLRELGTIGSGRAATSLAELVGTRVEISVPDTRFYPSQRLAELFENKQAMYVVMDAALSGSVGGKEYILLPENEAKTLGGALLGMSAEDVNLKDEMTVSSLKEVANILLSSYMNALSELTELTILVDVPNLTADITHSTVDTFVADHFDHSEEAIYVKSVLKIDGKQFEGFLVFVPEHKGLELIFEKLNLSQYE